MVTSPKLVAEQPKLVQRFVDATIQGWASYLHGDPKPGNALIRQGNTDLDDERIAYAREAMRKYAIFDSADVQQGGIGAMSDAQWTRIRGAMVGDEVPTGPELQRAYTLQFVNKRIGA